MPQIYLAAPFFSDEQIDRAKRIESALDANPTVKDYYSPRQNQKTENPEFSAPWAAEVFQRDVTNVMAADIIAYSITPGTDSCFLLITSRKYPFRCA